MNRLMVTIPYSLKGWLSQQREVQIALMQGYESDGWVIVPPVKVQNSEEFSSQLYSRMFNRCEEIMTINYPRRMVSVIYRFPNNAENVDYEMDDFKELENEY